ncbi:hypothetical protein [Anabaena sp. UHCC 0204]|uniref:hypothetical protein n=1 Tax=Anabaena sp. UHCC 0204 TaxID=2590009 RepID=UPI0020C24B72|nr:hypothetical protein [Anabaena sp. UHCC 0204]
MSTNDIESHIDYLEQRLQQLNQEIETLTQNNQQWIDKVNLFKTTPGIGQVISTTLVSDSKQISHLIKTVATYLLLLVCRYQPTQIST